jgi:hypothetical protein
MVESWVGVATGIAFLGGMAVIVGSWVRSTIIDRRIVRMMVACGIDESIAKKAGSQLEIDMRACRITASVRTQPSSVPSFSRRHVGFTTTRGIVPVVGSMDRFFASKLTNCLDKRQLNPVTVLNWGSDQRHIFRVSYNEVPALVPSQVVSKKISYLEIISGVNLRWIPRISVFSTLLAFVAL